MTRERAPKPVPVAPAGFPSLQGKELARDVIGQPQRLGTGAQPTKTDHRALTPSTANGHPVTIRSQGTEGSSGDKMTSAFGGARNDQLGGAIPSLAKRALLPRTALYCATLFFVTGLPRSFTLRPFAYVAESVEDPALYYNNNVGGTVELVEAMRDCSVRHIVLSSSCAVYGVPQSVPIGETSPLDPISPYGASKMMCEQLLRDWSDAFPLDWMALRYFNAAGADPEGEIGECHVPETHAIPLILKAAREGTAFTIYGDDYPTGDQSCVRDYTHVTDLACAHVIALHKLLEGMESAAINIGTGRGSSVRELIEIARQVTGRDIPVRISQRRTGDPPALVSDPARARTLLGWSPRYPDLAQQISHAWAWHQGGLRTWRRFQKAHLA
jgi:UDP-glucose-4-epimerase GalE